MKLRGIETTAVVGSQLISRLLNWSVLFMASAFCGVAGAFYLSAVLDSFALGFLSVGCFFLVIWIVLLLTRKRLIAASLKDKIIYSLSAPNEAEHSES
jgi:hypothetical protein